MIEGDRGGRGPGRCRSARDPTVSSGRFEPTVPRLAARFRRCDRRRASGPPPHAPFRGVSSALPAAVRFRPCAPSTPRCERCSINRSCAPDLRSPVLGCRPRHTVLRRRAGWGAFGSCPNHGCAPLRRGRQWRCHERTVTVRHVRVCLPGRSGRREARDPCLPEEAEASEGLVKWTSRIMRTTGGSSCDRSPWKCGARISERHLISAEVRQERESVRLNSRIGVGNIIPFGKSAVGVEKDGPGGRKTVRYSGPSRRRVTSPRRGGAWGRAGTVRDRRRVAAHSSGRTQGGPCCARQAPAARRAGDTPGWPWCGNA